jgi:hypothetical protein
MSQTQAAHKIKTRILYFKKSNPLCNKLVKFGGSREAAGDKVRWRMLNACRIHRVTDTRREYVTLIAYPRQKWLRERASIYRL